MEVAALGDEARGGGTGGDARVEVRSGLPSPRACDLALAAVVVASSRAAVGRVATGSPLPIIAERTRCTSSGSAAGI